jgi:hypothetical protein
MIPASMALKDTASALRAALPAILGAIAFRFACYAVMTALALWNELRPAPALPDTLLDHLPYVAWVDRLNYLAWLACYLPLALVFLASEPRRWVRYMITGGLVSLARGVCICLTGLGSPNAAHAGAGLMGKDLLDAYLDLVSPIGVFVRGSAHSYLTQDLFFSGHAATTFLMVLYLWNRPRLRFIAIAGHVAVVASVMLSRLHYSIDVVGAWGITFAIFALREWAPARGAR